MRILEPLLQRMPTRISNRPIIGDELDVSFVKKGGWLGANLPPRFVPPMLPIHESVEERANETQLSGDRPLWEGYRLLKGYKITHGTRRPNEVRSEAQLGRLYSWLAGQRDEDVIVEFGTAFGVSGMYWLSGMQKGRLYTFEPNANWAASAEQNLRSVSDRFTLTVDTFEAAGPKLLAPASVGIAFVDAIHASDFVFRQYEILKPLMKRGGLVIFDDIHFSWDMRRCWRQIARDPSLAASATVTERIGIIELPG
ncbi:MAG TPA: class I SAM-dependent methyltransferase [Rhizobiaceae bacterium]|nr:class I SAM-dependent methyltransferase [Rhizobiaceae bacterium]